MPTKKALGGKLYRNGLTSTAGISFIADKKTTVYNSRTVFRVVEPFRRCVEQCGQLISLLGGDFNFAS